MQSVKEWEKTLCRMDEVVILWTRAQEEWLHLEDIFVNDEVLQQLSYEAIRKFEVCDKGFRLVMSEASKNPLVVTACCRLGCLDELQALLSNLEQSQNFLRNFLASKRQVFPRLNFISDKELLSIIGGKFPQCVQTQVSKVTIYIKHWLLLERQKLNFSYKNMEMNKIWK